MLDIIKRSASLSKLLGIDIVISKVNNLIIRQKKLMEQVERLERATEVIRDSDAVCAGTQILLALKYQELARQGVILPFSDVEFKNHSQSGEDGILHYLFSVVGTCGKQTIEICAGNGKECNSANLILNHGWHALLMDGDEANVQTGLNFFNSHPNTKILGPTFLKRWITRENINLLIENAGHSGEIDLFSLDIDGVDYWVWEAVTCISPRVVILEFNAHLWEEPITVPYRHDFVAQWINVPDASASSAIISRENIDNNSLPLATSTFYGGASLAALNKLSRRKGYRLIGCSSSGQNAFFMRNDIGTENFPEVTEESCYATRNLAGIERGREVLRNLEWEAV